MDHALSSYEKIAESIPVKIHQLINQNQFDDLCGIPMNRICVTFFLPHILDTGASGRNEYINTISEIAKNFRTTMTFIWVEGGIQTNLENIIDLAPMYPSLAILHMNKNIYSINRLSWNDKNINNFLKNLLSGSSTTGLVSLPSIPSIIKDIEWDGKDGVLEEESFSLSDIMDDE